MLESEIKKLTIAIENLTLQLSGSTELPAPPTEVIVPVEAEVVTVTQVTTLAKELINKGADRKAIKEMIKGYGGKLISDLQPGNLQNLHNDLEAMK
jgi:hypothetical protein